MRNESKMTEEEELERRLEAVEKLRPVIPSHEIKEFDARMEEFRDTIEILKEARANKGRTRPIRNHS
jgi:hypothetical protein